MNKPYVKQVNEFNECVNPITKENPFINQFPTKKVATMHQKYLMLANGMKLKLSGNNRRNTCKRGKQSRLYFQMILN